MKEITLEPKKSTFFLTRKDGELLKDIIDDHTSGTFKNYCRKVGMTDTNVLGVLHGSKPCSTDFIQRLLSGTTVVLKCSLTILFKNTEENTTLPSTPEAYLDAFGTDLETPEEF